MIHDFINNLKYPEKNPDIYYPSNDSYLFLDYIDSEEFDLYRIEEFLHDSRSLSQKQIKILDMGCGTGILGLSLLYRLIHLLNVERKMEYKRYFLELIDINPEAIKYTKEFIELNQNLLPPQSFTGIYPKIEFKYYISDLFGGLNRENFKDWSERYDFIVFNPPYLPSETQIISPSNRKDIDFSWDGGDESGNATILRFFQQIPDKIQKHTQIYTISSSHANIKHFLESIERDFEVVLLQSVHIFFEEILLFFSKTKQI